MTTKTRNLGDETTWEKRKRIKNVGKFLFSYLSSPYSTEAPLIVLGQPGSGKSLLATVLSAQLMSPNYTVITVPLREVDADGSIPSQIRSKYANLQTRILVGQSSVKQSRIILHL